MKSNASIKPLVRAVLEIFGRVRSAVAPSRPANGVVDDATFNRMLRKAKRRQRYARLLGALSFAGMLTTAQACQLWQTGVETVAGTRIYLSATQPDTYDLTGYQSTDIIWTLIGEITDGGTHGRKYNEVTHKPIATRGERVFKGSFSEGSKTVQLGLDRDDSGQTLAKTALNSDSPYSFKVVYQGGDIDFFQALVMSFETQAAGVDTVRSASMMLRLTTTSAGVGIVEYNAT